MRTESNLNDPIRQVEGKYRQQRELLRTELMKVEQEEEKEKVEKCKEIFPVGSIFSARRLVNRCNGNRTTKFTIVAHTNNSVVIDEDIEDHETIYTWQYFVNFLMTRKGRTNEHHY